MTTEITFWEYALFGIALAYVISVILMRTEKNQRKEPRRKGERRVHMQTVAIERRQAGNERRIADRRA